MSSDIRMFSTFCDDIRFETGNKFSLMGCYWQEMRLVSFPAVLPRLCVQVAVSVPIDSEVDKIKVDVTIDGKNIAEQVLLDVDVILENLKKNAEEDMSYFPLFLLMVFSPLEIKKPTSLYVTAKVGDEEIPAGRLLFTRSQQVQGELPV